MIKLLIDDRERAVTLHKEELSTINHEIKRITTADYIVINESTGTVIAVIERKSLADFASSIKDGRSENIAKLCDFRAKSGCRIIYLIEGKMNPRQDEEFARIPYKIIESSIFHLIARDNICVLRTTDTLDTAKTLVRFINSMKTLKTFEPTTELPEEIKIGNAELTTMITTKHVKSDLDIVREMWASFKGITIAKADEYIKHWSLYNIICEKIPRETIVALKLSNGRSIDKKVINELFAPSYMAQCKILTCIPMISKQAAEMILKSRSLKELLLMPAEEISKIKISEKKSIGKHSETIVRLFNYSGTSEKS